jgi:sortase A
LRLRRVPLWATSVALVGVGVVLASYFSVGLSRGDAASDRADPKGFNVPQTVASSERPGEEAPAGGPKDKTLELTIPKLVRIRHDTVPDASAADEGALRRSAAIHLRGTGFPWQRGANVYLAGHRLGYPRTESFLAFWDLDELEEGDEVLISDATGAKYTYRVYKKFVVSPEASWVTKPVPSKNILTLQTCTLPDYKDRLIVRAELVDEVPGDRERGVSAGGGRA